MWPANVYKFTSLVQGFLLFLVYLHGTQLPVATKDLLTYSFQGYVAFYILKVAE